MNLELRREDSTRDEAREEESDELGSVDRDRYRWRSLLVPIHMGSRQQWETKEDALFYAAPRHEWLS